MTILLRARGSEWDNATLCALMEGSQALGVEAWGACGLFYRPYFNMRFGPPQISTDADVAVRTVEDAVALHAWLQKNHSWRRWSVAPIRDNFPFGRRGIVARLGAVRMISASGHLEVFVENEQVLADVSAGILRLDLSRETVAAYGGAESHTRNAVARARKLVREYPGLSLAGLLAEAYAQAYGEHVPVDGLAPMAALHKRVQEAEAGATNTVAPVLWQLRESELPEAIEVVRYYRTADRRAQPVPPVVPAALPEELEVQRSAKLYAELRDLPEPVPTDIAAPSGYASWLHYMSHEVADSMWREWLLNQSRARRPFGGRDAYLASILDYSLYAGRPGVKFSGEQKVTHGGWELNQHLVASALQLATDELFTELLSRGWSESSAKTIRAGMRLGMLVHDTGKLVSVHKPGAHGGASAALWCDTAPEWMNAEARGVAKMAILGHDYFGRVARAITEKVSRALEDPAFDPTAPTSYRGAVSAETIAQLIARFGPADRVAGLRILRRIWEADAGSVQSLRWVLPVADPLERLVQKAL